MSVTGAIIAGVGAAGSLGGAAMESNAAGKAASTQANAADYAANIQGQLGQEGLANENQQYENSLALDQPYLQSGTNSLATLDYLMGLGSPNSTAAGPGSGGTTLSIPGVAGSVSVPGVTSPTGTANTNLGAMGSLMSAYPGGQFTAPTAAQAAASPGEAFALQQGENAVQSGASANGSLLTGGTLNAENQYAQGLASTNYGNVYNQALQSYNTNYNTWANQNANTYNRLAAMAGMGQTTAQQLGSQGMQSAGQEASTLNATGGEIGQDYTNAANATASGYINSANAYGGALSGIGSSMSNLAMMNAMLQPSGQLTNQQSQSILNEAQNPTLGYTIQPTSY